MSKIVKIAVDAMGGSNSPDKVIDGIIHHNKKSKKVMNLIDDCNQETDLYFKENDLQDTLVQEFKDRTFEDLLSMKSPTNHVKEKVIQSLKQKNSKTIHRPWVKWSKRKYIKAWRWNTYMEDRPS